ncbi:MAG TPA: farnesyl diphosphate synthase [Phycisphaerae bacterium]|nr:farnesyl diphosphate synthase [Phycisphaerae bacterium]
MSVAMDEDIKSLLQNEAERVNRRLQALLGTYQGACPRLAEAMRYSLDAGGKRLRPALVLWCCELCGGDTEKAMPAALAVECVHTFSLIHDDLPALDNDDVRRGKPTNHKVFGEAMAILAGDGLLALAFELLARDVSDPRKTLAMIRELADAAGWQGMIGGEAADVQGESLPPDAAVVSRIHAAKTARLIEAACRLGGIAAGAAEKQLSVLGSYGEALGLAFQAADDLLDLTGGAKAIGKKTGKDAASGKQTYPRAVGTEEAYRMAMEEVENAIAALEPFGSRAARLVALALYVVERES